MHCCDPNCDFRLAVQTERTIKIANRDAVNHQQALDQTAANILTLREQNKQLRLQMGLPAH
jgi:hypothetical protein